MLWLMLSCGVAHADPAPPPGMIECPDHTHVWRQQQCGGGGAPGQFPGGGGSSGGTGGLLGTLGGIAHSLSGGLL